MMLAYFMAELDIRGTCVHTPRTERKANPKLKTASSFFRRLSFGAEIVCKSKGGSYTEGASGLCRKGESDVSPRVS